MSTLDPEADHMMIRRHALLTVACMLFWCLPAMAAPKAHVAPGSGVSVPVPDGWTLALEKGTRNFSLRHESTNVMLSFLPMKATEIDEARGKLAAAMKEMLTGIEMSEPSVFALNGMQGTARDGTATMDGIAVELGELVLRVPPDRAMFVFGLSTKGGDATQAATASVLTGIKRVGGAPAAPMKAHPAKAAPAKP